MKFLMFQVWNTIFIQIYLLEQFPDMVRDILVWLAIKENINFVILKIENKLSTLAPAQH